MSVVFHIIIIFLLLVVISILVAGYFVIKAKIPPVENKVVVVSDAVNNLIPKINDTLDSVQKLSVIVHNISDQISHILP